MISPKELRNRERLEKAKQRVTQTQKTPSQIEKERLRREKYLRKHPPKPQVVPIKLGCDKDVPVPKEIPVIPHVEFGKIEVWNVTVIIVNRRTLDLTRLCFESLRKFYPNIPVVIVDNWSNDESTEYVQKLSSEPNVVSVVNVSEEPHHAVGINIGIEYVRTDFFLTLDSDVEILRDGWLEKMLYFFKVYERMFAVGHVGMAANSDCTRPANSNEQPFMYIHPFCALWDLSKYKTLGIHYQKTGMPTCAVCHRAQEMGYLLMNFPIDPHNYPVAHFMRHKWGGTRDTLAIQADEARKKKEDDDMSFLQRRRKEHKLTREVVDPVKVPAGHPDYKAPAVSPPLHTELKPQPTQQPTTYRTAVSVADVTAVIVNFKTLWLARQAHSSLLRYYDIPVVLVDNGSGDDTTTQWVQAHGGMCNTENIGHGPALHRAIMERVKTPFVLTLDSDCTVFKGGWLEEMLDFFLGSKAYAIGWLRWVDRWSGVPLEWHADKPPANQFVRYVHPAVGLYDVEKYKTLRPFAQLGAPCLWNMLDADAAGYIVKDYPVFDYVKHLVAGTRRMYGGRWNPETLEKPSEWRARDNHPI